MEYTTWNQIRYALWLDHDEVESRVRSLQRALSPKVARIRYHLGEDHTGEASIFLKVTLSDQANKSGTTVKLGLLIRRLEAKITERLRLDRSGLYAYFNYRTVSEQLALKDKDWE